MAEDLSELNEELLVEICNTIGGKVKGLSSKHCEIKDLDITIFPQTRYGKGQGNCGLEFVNNETKKRDFYHSPPW